MLMWVGVQEGFAIASDPDAALWTVWPDALPDLLFVTAFLMICRDVWNANAPSLWPVRLSWLGLGSSASRNRSMHSGADYP
jgi:hypothetical protein